jgi:hypothetical protein
MTIVHSGENAWLVSRIMRPRNLGQQQMATRRAKATRFNEPKFILRKQKQKLV